MIILVINILLDMKISKCYHYQLLMLILKYSYEYKVKFILNMYEYYL